MYRDYCSTDEKIRAVNDTNVTVQDYRVIKKALRQRMRNDELSYDEFVRLRSKLERLADETQAATERLESDFRQRQAAHQLDSDVSWGSVITRHLCPSC